MFVTLMLSAGIPFVWRKLIAWLDARTQVALAEAVRRMIEQWHPLSCFAASACGPGLREPAVIAPGSSVRRGAQCTPALGVWRASPGIRKT